MMEAEQRQKVAGRVVRLTCEAHGDIWSAAAYCQHDIENTVRQVVGAHRAVYGANCAAVVTVDLLDAETMQPLPEGRSKWGYERRREGVVDDGNG